MRIRKIIEATTTAGVNTLTYTPTPGFLAIIRGISLWQGDTVTRDVMVAINAVPSDTVDEVLYGATVAPGVWNYPTASTNTVSVTSVEYLQAGGKSIPYGFNLTAVFTAMAASKTIRMVLDLEIIKDELSTYRYSA